MSDDLTNSSFDAISLDGKKLATVLKAVKIDEIEIEISKGFVTVKNGRSRVKIEIMEETQEIEIAKGYGKSIEFESCVQPMNYLIHAIDSNNPRYELIGLLITTKDKKVNMVSTDTKRLALVSIGTSIDDINIIVPKHAVTTIVKLFSDVDVETEADDVSFSIHSSSASYSTKLINGKFPNYERIIPESFAQTVTINAKALAEVISEASMFEDKISINIKEKELFVADLSKNTIFFMAEDKTADIHTNLSFCANSKHILDVLSSNEEETVKLCFNSFDTPFVLKFGSLQEIIMPVIVYNEDKEDAAKAA